MLVHAMSAWVLTLSEWVHSALPPKLSLSIIPAPFLAIWGAVVVLAQPEAAFVHAMGALEPNQEPRLPPVRK